MNRFFVALRAGALAALFAAVLGAAVPLRAAPLAALGGWEPIGPSNSELVAIVSTPGLDPTLLVSDLVSGVKRSADGGRTWSASGSGIPATSKIVAIALSPANDGVALAAGDGIYRSTDGGQTWAAATGTPAGAFFRTVVFHPTNSAILYAGSDGSSLFRSGDGGATWQSAGSGLDSTVRSIAIDPANPSTLLAGTDRGLYRSTEGAASWRAVGTGLPNLSRVNALAINPQDPQQVWVGSGSGLYRSSNGGLNVVKVTTGVVDAERINAIVFRPEQPNVITVASGTLGVARSTDGGQTWALANDGLNDLDTQMLAVNPSLPQLVYVATLGGGASVYNRAPLLQGAASLGGPGSAFRFEAALFPATSALTITVNGAAVPASVSSSATGRATFVLGTSGSVPPGLYQVQVSSGDSRASAVFQIAASAPVVTPPAGSPATIALTDIAPFANTVYLPSARR